MREYVSVLIVFCVFACAERRWASPESAGSEPKTEFSSTRQKQPGSVEYPKGLPAVPEFPGRPYHKVIAYELNGRYGDARAASAFYNRTGKQVELTEPQAGEFLSLFNDRKSYGHYEMACFNPRIGLAFYDESDQIVAYLRASCLERVRYENQGVVVLAKLFPARLAGQISQNKQRQVHKSLICSRSKLQT